MPGTSPSSEEARQPATEDDTGATVIAMSVQAQTVAGKDGRLDSWKAIADYLGRDVRSVQRWESERGLPVHRIPGTKGGGVFAYTAEIEAWLHGKSDVTDLSPAEPDIDAIARPALVVPAVKSASRTKSVLATAISLLMAAALVGGYFLLTKRPQSAAAAPIRPHPMIAVLPFANLSGDPSQDYFADGLTEELITEIGRLDPAQLGVIARTSSMKYKGTNKDVAEIGRDLKVDYILEGSVRREKGVARISAQLIQVQDQSHLWAQSYQQNVEHVLDVQREVAAAVSDKIRVQLLASQETERPESTSTLPEAYDNYLEGLYFSNQRSVSGLSEAANFFTRAIEIDPNYAAAYAGLAQCYTLLSIDAVNNPDEMKRKAKAAAVRAVALDDSSAEAHVILAGTKVFFDYDWPAAETHFRRALALNPNNALAHHWYANLYLAPEGRFQEAIAEMKVAQQLDPLSLIINTDLGYAYYLAGDDDDALTQFRKVLDMDPQFVPAHFDLTVLYLRRRMYDPAVKELALDLHYSGQDKQVPIIQQAYSKNGYTGVEQLVVASNDRLGGGFRPSLIAVAQANLFLGNTKGALSSLETAYANREAGIIYLKADPAWNELRSNPRFQTLERQAGLTN
jgi:TolB-like protein/Flp pilus assembly protein TadD